MYQQQPWYKIAEISLYIVLTIVSTLIRSHIYLLLLFEMNTANFWSLFVVVTSLVTGYISMAPPILHIDPPDWLTQIPIPSFPHLFPDLPITPTPLTQL